MPDRAWATRDPVGATVEWDAPTGCPDREGMQALIDATLGDVDEAELRAVHVRGVMQSVDEGFRLELTLDEGRTGTRQLVGASCQELSEAAALVIAMTIDPRLLERLDAATAESPDESPVDEPQVPVAPPEPEPSEETTEPEPETREGTDEPELEPDVRVEPVIDPPPSDERPRSRSLLVHADAGVGGGPLPGASGAFHLGVGLGGTLWRAELGASYWTPRSATSLSNAAVGVSAQLWAFSVQGCSEPRWRSLSFPLCTGVLAGALHAQGRGDLNGRRIASRWVAAALEPGLIVWLTARWGLALRARGHVALARPEPRSEPSGVIFTGAPIGGSLRAGVELRLP